MAKRGPKEGSIYQRKSDGLWVGVVHLGYDERGKRLRKPVYGHSFDEVLRKRQEVIERHRRGEPVTYERQTVGAFLKDWLEAKEEAVKPKTFDTYTGHVNNHILPSLGPINMQDLNQAHVLAMLKVLRRKQVRGRNLSPRTVQDVFDLLKRALDQAVQWGVAPRNVAALVDRPRAEHREMRFLERDQVEALLNQVRGTRWEALYTLALSVGLRRGELLALRWREDVDLDRGIVRVNRSLARLRGEIVIGTPKTRKSRRTVRLPGSCVTALRAHRDLQAFERRSAGERWHENGLVFPSEVGTPMDPRNLARHLDQTLERAKLPHIRVHDLRHTAASLMIAQKVDIKVVSEILGHASVVVTLNLYAHLMESQMQDYVDAMDSIFGQPKTS